MFKPHKGKCVLCNNNGIIVVKKGYCQICNYKIKKKKKMEGQENFKIPNLSITEKKKVVEGLRTMIKSKTNHSTGEVKIFKEIWDEREHISQLSGLPIVEFNIFCFAHILPKGVYPEMRLNKNNIWLMLPKEHIAQHNGMLPDHLKKKFKEKQDELKQKIYNHDK